MSHNAHTIFEEDLAEEMVEKLSNDYGKTLDDLLVDDEGDVYYVSESDSGSPSDVGYNVSSEKQYIGEELGKLLISLKLI